MYNKPMQMTAAVSYAHTSILAVEILIKLSSCLVIPVQGGGVKSCNFDRLLPLVLLCLPYLPGPGMKASYSSVQAPKLSRTTVLTSVEC